MKHANELLRQLLADNPNIHAAWFDDATNPNSLVILRDRTASLVPTKLPAELIHLKLDVHVTNPLRILRLPTMGAYPANTHQVCQNEPIKLGTQIQPQGADWLGTAGSPVRWLDNQGLSHHGILSNWHVLADGDERIGRTAHQPTAAYPAVATLAAWHTVTPDTDHQIDAAIADALVDGLHTISNEILGIGPIGDTPLDARVGLLVAKSGRTTQVTDGLCTAIGAAVRVGYGGFTATFVDQDIYSAVDGPFSAPGDSGSLIVGRSCRCAASLLFAGSNTLTIGNPIRHVAAALGLQFPFN